MDLGVIDTESRLPAQATAGAQDAERLGLAAYWIAGGWRDPLTLLALAGSVTSRVRLGASVVSVYGSHPTVLAEHALTANAAAGGRLVLGLGTSHQHMVAGRFGEPSGRPIRRLREFLTILGAFLSTGKADFQGEILSAHTELRLPLARPPRVLVAALSEQALRVAGRLADGTVTTFIGPDLLESQTIPTIAEAARQAGKAAPYIAVNMPLCVTADAEAARQRAREAFSVYSTVYKTYLPTFERQGVSGPGDLAVIGDEEAVSRQLARFAGVGVDHFCANPFGTAEEVARTTQFLSTLSRNPH